MGVSKNGGTPKWMVYNGKPYKNGWFGGENPLFSETSIYKSSLMGIVPHGCWNCAGPGCILHQLQNAASLLRRTNRRSQGVLGGGFKDFLFSSILTNIFQMGWNHQQKFVRLFLSGGTREMVWDHPDLKNHRFPGFNHFFLKIVVPFWMMMNPYNRKIVVPKPTGLKNGG